MCCDTESFKEYCEIVGTNNIGHVYCLFSGGRDSLAVLHLSKRVCESLSIPLEAIYVDTTISTPGNLEYVESVCKGIGARLVIVRPKLDFFAYVKRWGFPTATRRWCCYHLKIEPLKEYFIKVQDKWGLIVDGMRREESKRRSVFPKVGFHRRFKMLCYHPIFEWTKQDVLKYISRYNLPENPLYKKLPRATECWCTAFKTISQFRILKENWPELFMKFVEAEANLKPGKSALFKNGRKIYLKDL